MIVAIDINIAIAFYQPLYPIDTPHPHPPRPPRNWTRVLVFDVIDSVTNWATFAFAALAAASFHFHFHSKLTHSDRFNWAATIIIIIVVVVVFD